MGLLMDDDEAVPQAPGVFDARHQLLMRQLAQAQALAAGPGAHEHSSPMGALMHGLAGAGEGLMGGIQEHQLQGQEQQLLQQQQAAEAPGQKLLLALKQRQLDTENADAQAKSAERERLASTTNTTATTAAQLLQKYMGPKFKVPPGTSAAEILGLLPNAEKAYAVDEGAKNRAFAGSQAAQARGDAAAEKMAQKLKDDLDASKSRAGAMGKNQEVMNRAGRLEALLQLPGGGLAELTPPQVREAATALAAMIGGGGSQAVSQIDELVPQTLASQWAGLKQKLLNEPQSAEAGAFLQNMLDTAHRETKTVQRQILSAQAQRLPAHQGLRKARPEQWAAEIQAAGLDPKLVNEQGVYQLPKEPMQAGGAAPAGGGVQVVGPNGERGTIDPTELPEALANGWKRGG